MATYAFSDVHGNYKLWKSIQNYCKKDDILFFLGDAIDRGPDGIKIMQEMFEDNRVVYLLGNHEDTFLEYIKIGFGTVLKDPIEKQLIKDNEVMPTIKAYLALPQEQKEQLIINLKEKTFINYLYNNKERKIFLSHAGCSPKKINGAATAKDYLWDRKHISAKDWDNEYKDYIIIHGHTPVQLLGQKEEVLSYCGNHKIDIDLGCFTSKKIALINLDTLQSIYFVE